MLKARFWKNMVIKKWFHRIFVFLKTWKGTLKLKQQRVDDRNYCDCFPTPDELDAILELDKQKQLEMLTDVGLFNPETGEFSSEYYIICDRVFDTSR